MSDLVGNPEDRFSRVEAHIMSMQKFTHDVTCFNFIAGLFYFAN